jgi:hypothetical protein
MQICGGREHGGRAVGLDATAAHRGAGCEEGMARWTQDRLGQDEQGNRMRKRAWGT